MPTPSEDVVKAEPVRPRLRLRRKAAPASRSLSSHHPNDNTSHADPNRACQERDILFLIKALHYPTLVLRATQHLGARGDKSAGPALVAVLGSDDIHERATAATSLGLLAFKPAAPSLKKLATEDPDAGVRAWAMSALGQVSGTENIDSIMAGLSDPDWRVRRTAVVTLADIGDQNSIEGCEQVQETTLG